MRQRALSSCKPIKWHEEAGKTYIIERFAEDNYEEVVEINFKEMPSAKTIFEGDLTVNYSHGIINGRLFTADVEKADISRTYLARYVKENNIFRENSIIHKWLAGKGRCSDLCKCAKWTQQYEP